MKRITEVTRLLEVGIQLVRMLVLALRRAKRKYHLRRVFKMKTKMSQVVDNNPTRYIVTTVDVSTGITVEETASITDAEPETIEKEEEANVEE